MDFHDVVLPVIVEDELGSFIESPLGMYFMIWSPSSQVDPVVSVHSDDSLHWHSRSDVEWSVDMEAEFFVHSLGFKLFSILNIDDLPFLVLSVMTVPDDYWLSFSVFTTCNIKNLLVLDVNKLVSSILEDLPPL